MGYMKELYTEQQEVPYDDQEAWFFYQHVSDVYDHAKSVLMQKHTDYGPANIGQSPGGPLNGLRVRIWDKLARINNLLDSGADPQNESLRDSFLDLANYAMIGMLVLDEKWPE